MLGISWYPSNNKPHLASLEPAFALHHESILPCWLLRRPSEEYSLCSDDAVCLGGQVRGSEGLGGHLSTFKNDGRLQTGQGKHGRPSRESFPRVQIRAPRGRAVFRSTPAVRCLKHTLSVLRRTLVVLLLMLRAAKPFMRPAAAMSYRRCDQNERSLHPTRSQPHKTRGCSNGTTRGLEGSFAAEFLPAIALVLPLLHCRLRYKFALVPRLTMLELNQAADLGFWTA